MEQGFIKLFRKFTNWQWYRDINVKTLFIHLLLEANHKDKEWQGITVKRGQIIIGLYSLSEDLGLSIQKIRTAIQKLKNTQEITIKSTNKYSIVTVVNYDKYQINELELTNNSTNEQQTSNKQLTTNKNDKNIKNIILPPIIPLEDDSVGDEKEPVVEETKYFEDDNLNDTYLEYLQMRKEKKKSATETTITKQVTKLNKYSIEQILEILNYSIENGYQGLFYPKQKPEWLGKNIEDERLTDEELEIFKRKLAKK